MIGRPKMLNLNLKISSRFEPCGMKEKIGKMVRNNHKNAEVKVKCAEIRSSLHARH